MSLTSCTGQSKNLGKREIESILALEKCLKEHRARVHNLEDQLQKEPAQQLDVVDVGILLTESRDRCTRIAESIRRKRAALGVGQRMALQKLKADIYLQLRMNARALKTRICDRLRQRKFEIERLERSYRQAVNGNDFLLSYILF
jgi:hypothetical protein